MASFVREHLGITQERLASWVGVSRVALALAEGGSRGLPLGRGLREVRLTLATLGQLLRPDGPAEPVALPPVPAPAFTPAPLVWRLAQCRHEARNAARQLAALQARAQCFTNRLAALPILRAYAGPIPNPARETAWLNLLEAEALDGLRDDCGAGPQALLAGRLAGLQAEIGVLEALLGPAPPAPGASPPAGPAPE